ncbi:hypothetical protein BJY04DRAFT_180477 [Aspergillus karnatakaensis]|uniref:uncharacterized protein n=1 Tax=Aspergillus karnatakaensis TaxID=1810916 RepID=UPI003CCCB811
MYLGSQPTAQYYHSVRCGYIYSYISTSCFTSDPRTLPSNPKPPKSHITTHTNPRRMLPESLSSTSDFNYLAQPIPWVL